RWCETMLDRSDWDLAIAEWVAHQTVPDGDREAFDRVIRGTSYGHNQLFAASEVAKQEFFAAGPDIGFPAFKEIRYRPAPKQIPSSARMPGKTFQEQTDFLVERCVHVCRELL